MSLSGQAVEAFVMARSCLEYAGYALAIFRNPALEVGSAAHGKPRRPQTTGGAISPAIASRNGPCGRVGHGNSVRCGSIWALLKTFAKAPECTMIGGPNGALTAAVEIAGSRCLTEEVSHSV